MAIPMGLIPNNFMRNLQPRQPAPMPQNSSMMQPMTGQNPVNSQQFGLSGAESAFNQGLQGAGQSIQQGTNQALGTLH